MDSYIT
jgi:thiol-disulfide isomerase/thioredoxin